MSKVTIAGDVNGSGVFTLAAPNGNTNRTLTLPDEAGTVLTTAGVPSSAMPAGSVIQVVSVAVSTQANITITQSDALVPGMSLNITPKKDGSKFRIDVRLFHESDDGWNNIFNLHRNSTRVNTTSNALFHGLSMGTQTYGVNNENSSTPNIMHFATIDSTGSTAGSVITYSLVVCTSSVNNIMHVNRCFNTPSAGAETGISEIIITEIGV